MATFHFDTRRVDVFQYRDYRGYFSDVLAERMRQHRNYRPSHFAKDIGLSPAAWHEMIEGRRDFPIQKVHEVCRNLALSVAHQRYLTEMILNGVRQRLDCDDASSQENTRPSKVAITQLSPYSDAFFAMLDPDSDAGQLLLSDWRHATLVEMTQLTNVDLTLEMAAFRLGITVDELTPIVDRLVRFRLLLIEQGRLCRTTGPVTTPRDIPSEVVQNYKRKLLAKASQELSEQSVQQRDYSGVTMAIDSSRLEEAKRMIKVFRRDLMQFLEGGNTKDAVYCLSTQLFQLDPGATKGKGPVSTSLS
jgi:uncharacterized protein (TIGR02147 family)